MTFTGYVYHLIQPLSHLCHQCTPAGPVLMVIKWPKKSVGHTQMSLRHLLRLPDCVGLWRGGLCVHCGALHKSIEWQLRRKSRTDCILSSAYLWVRLQFNHIQYWLTLSGNHFLWVGVALEMAHVHIIWWNFSKRELMCYFIPLSNGAGVKRWSAVTEDSPSFPIWTIRITQRKTKHFGIATLKQLSPLGAGKS